MFIAPILEKEQQIISRLKSGSCFKKQSNFKRHQLYYDFQKDKFYLQYFDELNQPLRPKLIKQLDVIDLAIKKYGGHSSLSFIEQLNLLLGKL